MTDKEVTSNDDSDLIVEVDLKDIKNEKEEKKALEYLLKVTDNS
jgi:hypothetical protein